MPPPRHSAKTSQPVTIITSGFLIDLDDLRRKPQFRLLGMKRHLPALAGRDRVSLSVEKHHHYALVVHDGELVRSHELHAAHLRHKMNIELLVPIDGERWRRTHEAHVRRCRPARG